MMVADSPSPPTATVPVARRGFDVAPLIVAVVVVALDQATKAWVVNTLGAPEARNAITLIPGWLEFRHDQNTGAAFSNFQGQNAFLIILGLVIIGGLVYYYRALPKGRPALQIAVGAVLGGAIGNIIDRVRLGHVTDWIHFFHTSSFNFPTFNIADSCISVGMIVIALYLFFFDRPAQK